MATCLLLPLPLKSPNPNSRTSKITCSSITDQSQLAKRDLLNLVSDQDRGLKTQKDSTKRASIVKAIDALASIGKDTVTTGDSLSDTWRLLWTTEKEQLFIIQNAYLFGTQAGDVLQVIDVEKRTLNNVITFPPDGVFFVRSSIEIASSQRVNFRYSRSSFDNCLSIDFVRSIFDLFGLLWQIYKRGTESEELGDSVATIWAGLVSALLTIRFRSIKLPYLNVKLKELQRLPPV